MERYIRRDVLYIRPIHQLTRRQGDGSGEAPRRFDSRARELARDLTQDSVARLSLQV